MFTAAFWLAAGERAVKTFAQSLVALFIGGSTVITIDWQQALALAGTATLISVLTSIASLPLGPAGSPSLVPEPSAVPYVGDHETPAPQDPIVSSSGAAFPGDGSGGPDASA
jgi:hypothetical protein